jgi:hypothetical protein
MTIDVEAKDRNETASNITGTYRNCKLNDGCELGGERSRWPCDVPVITR